MYFTLIYHTIHKRSATIQPCPLMRRNEDGTGTHHIIITHNFTLYSTYLSFMSSRVNAITYAFTTANFLTLESNIIKYRERHCYC